MVAVGKTLRPPPALQAQTPKLATSQLHERDAFPIPKWRPRDGLNAAYPAWQAGVRRLLAAYGLTQAELFTAITICRKLFDSDCNSVYGSPQSLDAAAALAEAQRLDSVVAEWQALNTAVFWHVTRDRIPTPLAAGAPTASAAQPTPQRKQHV